MQELNVFKKYYRELNYSVHVLVEIMETEL